MLTNETIEELCRRAAQLLGDRAPRPLLMFLQGYESVTINSEAKDALVSRLESLAEKLAQSEGADQKRIRKSIQRQLTVALTNSVPEMGQSIDGYRRISKNETVHWDSGSKYDFEPEAISIALTYLKARRRPSDRVLGLLRENVDDGKLFAEFDRAPETWHGEKPPKEGDDDVLDEWKVGLLRSSAEDLLGADWTPDELIRVSDIFRDASEQVVDASVGRIRSIVAQYRSAATEDRRAFLASLDLRERDELKRNLEDLEKEYFLGTVFGGHRPTLPRFRKWLEGQSGQTHSFESASNIVRATSYVRDLLGSVLWFERNGTWVSGYITAEKRESGTGRFLLRQSGVSGDSGLKQSQFPNLRVKKKKSEPPQLDWGRDPI